MQNISEAVVDKVREDAQAIVKEAEEQATKELEKARTQRDARIEAEKKRLLTAAQEEAARTTAQNAMQARQKVANAKAAVLDGIVEKARESLKKSATSRESLSFLINDGIQGLGESDKIYVGVAEKDAALAREIVKSDKKLAATVIDVRRCDCTGGVAIENESKSLSVDNTYTTRLEMLLPRILPEIGKRLFR
jgi:vacuolar-type H+-ATPase subunit E/Vma4